MSAEGDLNRWLDNVLTALGVPRTAENRGALLDWAADRKRDAYALTSDRLPRDYTRDPVRDIE